MHLQEKNWSQDTCRAVPSVKKVAQPRHGTKCLLLILNELNQQEKQNKPTKTRQQLLVYKVSGTEKESPNKVITH